MIQEATDVEREEPHASALVFDQGKRTVRPAHGRMGWEGGRSERRPVTGRIGPVGPTREGADVHLVLRREKAWRTDITEEGK